MNAPNSKGRIDLYKRALSKKDPFERLKVAKSRRFRKGGGAGKTEVALEAEYAKRANDRLNAAFVEALEIKEDEVEAFIDRHLKETG